MINESKRRRLTFVLVIVISLGIAYRHTLKPDLASKLAWPQFWPQNWLAPKILAWSLIWPLQNAIFLFGRKFKKRILNFLDLDWIFIDFFKKLKIQCCFFMYKELPYGKILHITSDRLFKFNYYNLCINTQKIYMTCI